MELKPMTGKRPGLSRYIGRVSKSVREAFETLGTRSECKVLNNTVLRKRTAIDGSDVVGLYYHGNCIAEYYPAAGGRPSRVEVTDAGYCTVTTTERIAAVLHSFGLVTRVHDGNRQVGTVKYGLATLDYYTRDWRVVIEETMSSVPRVERVKHNGERETLELAAA